MALSHQSAFAGDPRIQAAMQRKTLSTIMEPQDEQEDETAPIHPIESMQGAFEESMNEPTAAADIRGSQRASLLVDSATRRRMLLENERYEDTHAAQWRPRPGEQFHPFWKLVAQISFGIYLLHMQMAKSDEDVLFILQTHVDEVDGFLERTTEDFDLAIDDIRERLRCLKLPLEHGDIFDIMLEDRAFRKQIVDGNEKIEHISNRTSAAMNDALRDIQHGLESTRELSKYTARLEHEWRNRTPEHEQVYRAMSGNAEGWFRCCVSLQAKANMLSSLLIQLGGIIAELQRRAGIASRKHLPNFSNPTGSAAAGRHSPSTSSISSISKSATPPLRSALSQNHATSTTFGSETSLPRRPTTPEKSALRNVTTQVDSPVSGSDKTRKSPTKRGSVHARSSSLKGTVATRMANEWDLGPDLRGVGRHSPSKSEIIQPTTQSVFESDEEKSASHRQSFTKALKFRRKVQFSARPPSTIRRSHSASSLVDEETPSPSKSDKDQFLTFLSSNHSSMSPLNDEAPAQPSSPNQPVSRDRRPDPGTARDLDSAYSSGISDERVPSPTDNNSRSATPNMQPGNSHSRYGPSMNAPGSPTRWPAKAMTILAPEEASLMPQQHREAAEAPVVRTAPEKRSRESSRPDRSLSSLGTLDIGPTKNKFSLKDFRNIKERMKKPFQQESIILSILFGAGEGPNGQF